MYAHTEDNCTNRSPKIFERSTSWVHRSISELFQGQRMQVVNFIGLKLCRTSSSDFDSDLQKYRPLEKLAILSISILTYVLKGFFDYKIYFYDFSIVHLLEGAKWFGHRTYVQCIVTTI
jgi:hypothetical protein